MNEMGFTIYGKAPPGDPEESQCVNHCIDNTSNFVNLCMVVVAVVVVTMNSFTKLLDESIKGWRKRDIQVEGGGQQYRTHRELLWN